MNIEFNPSSVDESGKIFTCKATNSEGTSQKSVTVDVQGMQCRYV